MTYLDTGCLVKLYFPEPESARVIAHVRGHAVCYTPLHELELVNAFKLKVFFQGASSAQVGAALALVRADLQSGVLTSPILEWRTVFQEAVKWADQTTESIGCRSLDILHCATARVLGAAEFITTDNRQKKLATEMGLNLVTF